MHHDNHYIMPPEFFGRPTFPLAWPELNWLSQLPKDTYFALWVCLPSGSPTPRDLPLGHSLYVVTFHQEHLDFAWLAAQAQRIDAPIIVLNDGSVYDFPFGDHVHFFNYYSWHHHMDTMMTWFPDRQPRNLRYKVSAVCNRITQAKLLVFTALMKYHARDQLLVKLGDWLEEKNVHFRQPTGMPELDQLSEEFFERWHGQNLQIDDFVNARDNTQRVNSNPWQPIYTQSALHFTNESYHYSQMITKEYGNIIYPGPSYSEKTFKCLVAGTPFIAVGQFESYRYLQELGFLFDYGDIDLSWDQDAGNLTRMRSLVQLIQTLAHYSIQDLDLMTRDSTLHNTHHLWSGEFGRRCRAHNQQVAQHVLDRFR